MSRILRKKLFQVTGGLTASLALLLCSTQLQAFPKLPHMDTRSEMAHTSILPVSPSPDGSSLWVSSKHKENSVATVTTGTAITVISDDSQSLGFDFNNDLNTEKHVSCYPNPAISYINFKFDKSVNKKAKLFIYSFTGRQMEELSISGNILKVSLDNYFRGLYVYQLRDAQGVIVESGKFQVKN